MPTVTSKRKTRQAHSSRPPPRAIQRTPLIGSAANDLQTILTTFRCSKDTQAARLGWQIAANLIRRQGYAAAMELLSDEGGAK